MENRKWKTENVRVWFSHFPLFQDFLHATDLTVREANLDAVRMCRRICQQIFDDADGAFSRALVLFEDDCDALSGADAFAALVIHNL